MEDNTAEQMEAISELLDTALEFGLEVEVIYYALKYIKEHPELSPVAAFQLGITEWIK